MVRACDAKRGALRRKEDYVNGGGKEGLREDGWIE